MGDGREAPEHKARTNAEGDAGVVTLFEAGMHTGEGPLWDHRTGTLHCVDSTNPALWSFDASGRVLDRMALAERIGFVVLTDALDVLIAGLRTGLHRIDLRARTTELLLDPEPDMPGNRINDGVVDLDGSLVFGTLDDGLAEPTGRAYQLTLDGELRCFDGGYIVSNGPYPHPDGERFVFIDSEVGQVKAFQRRADGTLARDGLFCEWDMSALGVPDGCVCDTDGGVWIAHWDGGCVTRWTANGRLDQRIDLPASRITKPAFGGPDLSTLFVTSANRDIELGTERLAGSLFAIPTDRKGIKARPCRVAF